MKKILKTFGMAFGLLVISVNSFAQAHLTDYATATATIITPLQIWEVDNMNFGNVAVSNVAGTAILTPQSTRSATGGVTLPLGLLAGTVEAAYFTVSGNPGYIFNVTLPPNDPPLTITHVTIPTAFMTVDNFSMDLTNPTLLPAGGQVDLHVGATLHVTGDQTPGVYYSGTPGFAVSINYQ